MSQEYSFSFVLLTPELYSPNSSVFRPRQIRQLPRVAALKGRLLGCYCYFYIHGVKK